MLQVQPRGSRLRGEKTCPLCAGRHRLRDCTSSPHEYKCVNYITFFKFNPTKPACSNHSSLDKRCSSLQTLLENFDKTQTTAMFVHRNSHTHTGTLNRQDNPHTHIKFFQLNLQNSRVTTDNLVKLLSKEQTYFYSKSHTQYKIK
jgi:hypothetical protein